MPFIIISGNIGSGKSTLSAALARALNGRHLPEDAGELVFLSDFYRNMERWAFHSQLQFVTKKFDQQYRAVGGTEIQDGSAYESFAVFARKLHDDELIGQREFHNLSKVYQLLADLLPPPDLLVHLTAPVEVLLNRIRSRGRHYEQSIPAAYLEDLDARYRGWTSSFSACPILRIDTAAMNLLNSEADVESIARRVRRTLTRQAEPSVEPPRAHRRYLDIAEADSRRVTHGRLHPRNTD